MRLDELPGDPGTELCNEASDEPARFGPEMAAATQARLLWLPDVLTDFGCRVVTVDGWQTRSRPASSGGFAPVGVLAHHTATTSSATRPAPTLGLLVNGRSDLPGPLCQISTGYDGVVRVVAAGRANHAGNCKAMGPIPAGDGNALYVGDEIDYNGTQKMSTAQFDAAAKAHAAILHGLKRDTRYLGRHADTSVTGKWDNGGYTTAQMRTAAAAIKPGGVDDLSAGEVWGWKAKEFIDENNNKVADARTASDVLWSTHKNAVTARREEASRYAAFVAKLDALAAQSKVTQADVAALKASLVKLSTPIDLDALASQVAAKIGPAIGATIEQAIAEGIRNRLAQ